MKIYINRSTHVIRCWRQAQCLYKLQNVHFLSLFFWNRPFPFSVIKQIHVLGIPFLFLFSPFFFCKMLLIYQKNHDDICDINFLTNAKPLCTAEQHALWHVWNGDYESFLFIFFKGRGLWKLVVSFLPFAFAQRFCHFLLSHF